MLVTAIILAAGKGKRLTHRTPKPLIRIKSKPLIIYSLEAISRNKFIKNIIIVVNKYNKKRISTVIRQYKIQKIKRIVLGGERRQDSAYNALKVIDRDTQLILIHDAARPFIEKKLLVSVIKEAQRYGAAVLGVPVKVTIKRVTRSQGHKAASRIVVEKTLDRSRLWEIQTPQVFRKELILRAYNKFKRLNVTDDASLVEKLGSKVVLVEGSSLNIKITAKQDLIIAKAILNTRACERGAGY
ncbi:MAG: 2-C-methyl-D-erythritol 4-phosphate cytidylyltransferase [Candidatus Omnitrophota bacterium]|nr:MAG: 2-C-methyl-D-erythritol 4-phosphate cytidylyltransferase [Candidatus Omnitrophota bacterium]